MLEQAECDVLILLDCCCGASSTAETGSGVTEVIAACDFETWTPRVGEPSFSCRLTNELRYWSSDASRSVAMLHMRVLSTMKHCKPRTGNGRNEELKKTPIHSVLTNEGVPRSIELRPLPRRRLRAVELPASSTLSISSAVTDLNFLFTASSKRSLKQVWPDPKFKYPKVLISLALDEDDWYSTAEWKDWLSSVPALATCAKVEGVYKSDGTLILLSLPVAVWDMLPNDAAVSFLCFIESDNMIEAASWSLESSPEPLERVKRQMFQTNAPGSLEFWSCSECKGYHNVSLAPERCPACGHERCFACTNFTS